MSFLFGFQGAGTACLIKLFLRGFEYVVVAFSDHLTDVRKMVELGSGSQRKIDEVMPGALCVLPDRAER